MTLASKEGNNGDDEGNTIDCGKSLTIMTKKNRDAEIPPVSRVIVNDEEKHFQCEENEGKEDKIKLKEGDKVRVIAQTPMVNEVSILGICTSKTLCPVILPLNSLISSPNAIVSLFERTIYLKKK